MHAFIVRPFGVKKEINFDKVEKELIRPALKKAGYSGGATSEFIEQGNIRTDMFEQLLIADLVIADISIHNANVFYELGIRHAFRDKRTFLIKSKGDEAPFDLKTDRYLQYDAKDPSASLPKLIEALEATWESEDTDSPVFQLLPGMDVTDPAKYIKAPIEFVEEVERYKANKENGNLQMLSAEVDEFAWKLAAFRLIGNTQFELNDLLGAKITWNQVLQYNSLDLEANTLLGTIYQKLGDLVRSDQSLKRALKNRSIPTDQKAEIKALMASNAKSQWEQEWKKQESIDTIQKTALQSQYLARSFKHYNDGFVLDRNHFYSGLNALAMVSIITELAILHPDEWAKDFKSDIEAKVQLDKLSDLRSDLKAVVKLSIESKIAILKLQDKTDFWAEISAADLVFLSVPDPGQVQRAYKRAIAEAPDYARYSARNQIKLYERLGILTKNVQAALEAIPEAAGDNKETRDAPRIILFTGHRIDSPGRDSERFPVEKESQARAMIKEAVSKLQVQTEGELIGISGGASGGDILFHEVCEELSIPTRIYLVVPKSEYIKASVVDSGAEWVQRFNLLYDKKSPEVLSVSKKLPKWLRPKKDYSIWQRSNLWMLHNALYTSSGNLTLIALWDGKEGDGPGGTVDMVRRARERGAVFVPLDARELIK